MVSLGKVSIITSVFKAEEFLSRCVDSVLNQTYSDFELILVHDPTDDCGGDICDKYAQQDPRVVVIHRKCIGSAASARNEGLKVATGDYIGFIDSDDWIENDTFEYSVNLINANEADIVQFGFEMANNFPKKIVQQEEELKVYYGKDALEYLMYSSTTGTAGFVIWRCLFRADVLKNVLFRDTMVNEDMDWKYRAFSNCKKLMVSNQKKYFYFQSDDSLSSGGLKKKDFGLFDSVEALYKLTSQEDYGHVRYLGDVKKARTEFSLLCKAAYFGISDSSLDKKTIVKDLTHGHRKNLKILLKAPIPLSRKMLSILFAINYKLAESFIHLAKGML